MMKDKLKAITAILKKRFPNLTVEETVDLACDIFDAVTRVDNFGDRVNP